METHKPRKAYRHFTPDESNFVTTLFNQGKTFGDIGKAVNRNSSCVRRHLMKTGAYNGTATEFRKAERKIKHVAVALAMGAGNRSRLRDSAERCVMCLSTIGLGRRVIARVMGLPDGMAANCMRKLGAGHHPRVFITLKKQAPTAMTRRTNQKIARSLRSRVRDSMKSQGLRKDFSARSVIGCTVGELRDHLQSKFQKWMTWENYGTRWHIDHIVPCAKFCLSDPEEVKRCFHWSNLRPLCAKQNMSDGERKGVHLQPCLPI